jgi:predicted RNA-binding Zn ribbon-like protein
MSPQEKFRDLKIVGERKSINFINTIDWRGKENPEEYINDFPDLVDWAVLTGLINKYETKTLKLLAESNPEQATYSHKRAINFRETAYRVLCSMLLEKNPKPEDKELLDSEMLDMFSYIKLNLKERQFVLKDQLDLDHILRLIVKDLIELMTSNEISQVKRCQSKECGWLFIDSSKNKSRIWCQMRGCGNREKARRYYNRSKQGI